MSRPRHVREPNCVILFQLRTGTVSTGTRLSQVDDATVQTCKVSAWLNPQRRSMAEQLNPGVDLSTVPMLGSLLPQKDEVVEDWVLADTREAQVVFRDGSRGTLKNITRRTVANPRMMARLTGSCYQITADFFRQS